MKRRVDARGLVEVFGSFQDVGVVTDLSPVDACRLELLGCRAQVRELDLGLVLTPGGFVGLPAVTHGVQGHDDCTSSDEIREVIDGTVHAERAPGPCRNGGLGRVDTRGGGAQLLLSGIRDGLQLHGLLQLELRGIQNGRLMGIETSPQMNSIERY